MHYSAHVQLATRYTCTSHDKSYQASHAIVSLATKSEVGVEKARHELYLLVDGKRNHMTIQEDHMTIQEDHMTIQENHMTI